MDDRKPVCSADQRTHEGIGAVEAARQSEEEEAMAIYLRTRDLQVRAWDSLHRDADMPTDNE